MDDRPYLSIGDVLALLQREFPDVTISKIRFLESRGLLVPDRTPSGYRKFYEHDVERLRWILRQQREHFLPLKVIKGRLEGQEPTQPAALFEMGEQTPLSATGHSGQNGLDRPPASPLLASVPSHARNGTLPEGSRPGGGSSGSSGSPAGGGAGAAGAGAGTAAGVTGATTPQGSQPTERQPARAADPSSAAAESDRDTGGPAQSPPAAQLSGASTPAGAGEHSPPPTPERRTATSRRTEETGGGEGAREGRQERDPAPNRESRQEQARGPSSGRPNEVASLVGVSLTAAELAQASGLDVQQVADLESYGLIEARTVGGVRCFDEAALAVASLAAGFARFGVEARHLRVFKYAAERQTGLYSQIVLPLLRQRNPDARRRALEDVAQLSDLGVSLQSCFAKAALRDLTGS